MCFVWKFDLFTRNFIKSLCWEDSVLCFTGKASDLLPAHKVQAPTKRLFNGFLGRVGVCSISDTPAALCSHPASVAREPSRDVGIKEDKTLFSNTYTFHNKPATTMCTYTNWTKSVRDA